MADALMGLDTTSLFGPSVLGGDEFGVPNGGFIFNNGDPANAADSPWLSNAPDGSVFSFGNSTPTMDFLDTMPGGGGASGGLNWDALLKGLGGLNFGGMMSGVSNFLPDKSTAMGMIPGTMALGYAAMQPDIDTGPMNAVLGSLEGNRNAVVKAATDPVQQNIAAGYGDLLQSQGLRGIRGSSFGNTDIANYLDITGRGLANAGANASQGSLALQGNLAAQIAALKNQSQQMKNQLYGTAFDVLGRGLNPKGYTGSTNINVGGGGGTAARATDNGFLGTGIPTADIGAGAALASLFSDRRLKTNIVKIADDPRGFGIYEYEMFGERNWGVMADEVELVIPDAVTICAGYKMVDYGRLYGR